MKNIVGIIPAGGLGTRMHPYKMWKELIPVGYRNDETVASKVPNVMGEYVINNMREAQVTEIYMVINNRKQELFRFFGDGSQYDSHIAYLNQDLDKGWYGMPIALDIAYPFVKESTVLMGMPDTIVCPEWAFKELLKLHRETEADLTIGVFPTDNPTQLAPVNIDQFGNVTGIYDKPKVTSLYNTWNIAIWEPCFTQLMHQEVEAYKNGPNKKEMLLSDMFTKAIASGFVVKGKLFEMGKCYDVGSIKNLYDIQCEFEEREGAIYESN